MVDSKLRDGTSGLSRIPSTEGNGLRSARLVFPVGSPLLWTEARSIMFDRRMAEEILNTTALAVSEMSFCEVTDRYLAVNGQLDPVPERAALPQDLDVRRLSGRDSVLPCARPGWRYALFTVGDGGEPNGCGAVRRRPSESSATDTAPDCCRDNGNDSRQGISRGTPE